MSTVEIKHADDVARALTAVLPHTAPRSSYLPALSAVHFSAPVGALVLAATNRYTLGMYRVDQSETDGELSVLVDLDDAKAILRMVKAGKSHPMHLVTTDRELTVSTVTGGSLTVRLLDAQFPNIDSIVRPLVDKILSGNAEPPQAWAANPAYLALFAKAADRGDIINLHMTGQHKAVLVTIGDNFAGVIMPSRRDDYPLPAWLTAASAPVIAKAS